MTLAAVNTMTTSCLEDGISVFSEPWESGVDVDVPLMAEHLVIMYTQHLTVRSLDHCREKLL